MPTCYERFVKHFDRAKTTGKLQRTLLMNLKLLILDETASRIDQHTELVVENALKSILKTDWL